MEKNRFALELSKKLNLPVKKANKEIVDFNNIDANIVILSNELRNKGFLKEAIALQQAFVNYKKAERELDGDKILNLAHPKATKVPNLGVEVKPIQDIKKDILRLSKLGNFQVPNGWVGISAKELLDCNNTPYNKDVLSKYISADSLVVPDVSDIDEKTKKDVNDTFLLISKWIRIPDQKYPFILDIKSKMESIKKNASDYSDVANHIIQCFGFANDVAKMLRKNPVTGLLLWNPDTYGDKCLIFKDHDDILKYVVGKQLFKEASYKANIKTATATAVPKILSESHPKAVKVQGTTSEVKPAQQTKEDILKILGVKVAGEKSPKILNDVHPKATKVKDTDGEVLSVQDAKERIMKLVGIKNAGIMNAVRFIKKIAGDFIPNGYFKVNKSNSLIAKGRKYNKDYLLHFVSGADIDVQINKLERHYRDAFGAGLCYRENINTYKGIKSWLNGDAYPHLYYPEDAVGYDLTGADEYPDISKFEKDIATYFRGASIIQSFLDNSDVSNSSIEAFTKGSKEEDVIFHILTGDKHSFVNYKGDRIIAVEKEFNSSNLESDKEISSKADERKEAIQKAEYSHWKKSNNKEDLYNQELNVMNSVSQSKDSDGKWFWAENTKNDKGDRKWWDNDGKFMGYTNDSNAKKDQLYKDALEKEYDGIIRKNKDDKNQYNLKYKDFNGFNGDLKDGDDIGNNTKYKWTPNKNTNYYDAYAIDNDGTFLGSFPNNKTPSGADLKSLQDPNGWKDGWSPYKSGAYKYKSEGLGYWYKKDGESDDQAKYIKYSLYHPDGYRVMPATANIEGSKYKWADSPLGGYDVWNMDGSYKGHVKEHGVEPNENTIMTLVQMMGLLINDSKKLQPKPQYTGTTQPAAQKTKEISEY